MVISFLRGVFFSFSLPLQVSIVMMRVHVLFSKISLLRSSDLQIVRRTLRRICGQFLTKIWIKGILECFMVISDY